MFTARVAMAASLSLAALAQEAAPPQNSQQAAAPADYWHSMKYSGIFDVYGAKSFNNPGSKVNSLRNFDVKANRPDINMARFSIAHDAEPIGFRVDFAAGRATQIIHGAEQGGRAWQYIQQAYVSAKPFKGSGFQLDFGKFYTAAGAEVTETHLNWNYSRALLYANGPYYHFGVRATTPVNKYWTVGGQLLNGWNNVKDNNTGKTVGLTSALSLGKVTVANAVYLGPEKTDTNEEWRNFYDTVVIVNWNKKVSSYVNFDYGVDKNRVLGDNSFWGIGVATRVAVTDKIAIAPRFEVYDDERGFITGTQQRLNEFTITGEYKFREGVISRLEYRRDSSDTPFFTRGASPASAKAQTTLLLGFVFYFDVKR